MHGVYSDHAYLEEGIQVTLPAFWGGLKWFIDHDSRAERYSPSPTEEVEYSSHYVPLIGALGTKKRHIIRSSPREDTVHSNGGTLLALQL